MLGGRQEYGYGVKGDSSESAIGTGQGVITVRSLRRKGIEDERWCKDDTNATKRIPWEPVPGQGDRDVKSKVITYDD